MIVFQHQVIDPHVQGLEAFNTFLNQMNITPADRAEVHWLDVELNQDQLLALYLPYIQALQARNIDVHCLMSVREAKRLVRYPKMMFIDPLFLRKFKFKSIRFQLPSAQEIAQQ